MQVKITFSSVLTYSSIIYCTALLMLMPINVLAGKYVLAENYDGSPDKKGVCTVYENNLREIENKPYGMACEIELDPKLGLARPNWISLDPVKHIYLLQEIYKLKRHRKNSSISINEIEKLISRKKITMELTKVDLDSDGVVDNVVRIGNGKKCDPKERMEKSLTLDRKKIYKISKDLKHVDIYSRSISSLDNIFLYDGKVYSDTYYGNSIDLVKDLGWNATIYVEKYGNYGDGKVCKFNYYGNK